MMVRYTEYTHLLVEKENTMAKPLGPVFRSLFSVRFLGSQSIATSIVLMFAAMVILSACGDSGPSGPDPNDSVASVSISPPQATVDVGSTTQLSATVTNGHGETMSVAVTWGSSQTNIATVSASGLVEGVAEGTATITASVAGKSGTSNVAVNDPFPPGEPTNVTASPVSDTEVVVSWTDQSSTEDEFRIDREVVPAGLGAESAALASVEVGTVGPNVTTFTDTGLDPETTYRYWVRACNENGCSDSQQAGGDVTTYAQLSILTESVGDGWVGESYQQTLVASGGGGVITWSVHTGSLPDGLTLGDAGALSGTPTTSGTWEFTVQAAGGGQTVTQALTFTVYAQPSVVTSSVPDGAVGIAYSFDLQATGGRGTFTWAISGGAVPPGLSFSVEGQISGTPTTEGPYPFTVTVTSDGRSASQAFSPSIHTSLCPVQAEIPQTECEALEALYEGTNGDGWVTRTGWMASTTPCSWHGVSCSQGSVTGLELGGNSLMGALPPELGDLTQLVTMSFWGNQLTGGIPPEFGNLTELITLELQHNDLTGSIPSSVGNLTKLQSFRVRYQDMTGVIPPEIGNCTDLRRLLLGSNQFSGPIPETLGNLTKITMIDLSGNDLTGTIPSSLGNLVESDIFYLNHNELTGTIPPELGNLSKVTWFSLRSNHLTGSIPTTFGSMASITHLMIGDNQLSGSIPAELGSLANLKLLQLNDNQLTGSIPGELANLAALEDMRLEDNQLDALIPLGVAQLGGAIQSARGESHCSFRPGNVGLSLVDNAEYRAADLDADGAICGVPFPGPGLVVPWPFV